MDKHISCKTERKGGSYWTNCRIIKRKCICTYARSLRVVNGLSEKENLHKGEKAKPVAVQENVILVDENNDTNTELASVMMSNAIMQYVSFHSSNETSQSFDDNINDAIAYEDLSDTLSNCSWYSYSVSVIDSIKTLMRSKFFLI